MITASPTLWSQSARCIVNGVMKGQQTIAKWNATPTAERDYLRPMKLIPRCQLLFYRRCLPRWPQRIRLRTLWSYHMNHCNHKGFTKTLQNTKFRDGEICKCNAKSIFPRAKRAPIILRMITYLVAYMLDKEQWYTTHAHGNLSQFCHPWVVTVSKHFELQFRFQERKLTLLSKVRMRPTWLTCPDVTSANSNNGLCQISTLYEHSDKMAGI